MKKVDITELDIEAMAKVARKFLQKSNLKTTPMDSWPKEDRQRVYGFIFETMTKKIGACKSEEPKNNLIDELSVIIRGKNALEERLEEQKKISPLKKLATWVRKGGPFVENQTQQLTEASTSTDPALAEKIGDFLASKREIETLLEKDEKLSETNIDKFFDTRETPFDPEKAISVLLDDSKNNQEKADILKQASLAEREDLYGQVLDQLINSKDSEDQDHDQDTDHESSEHSH